MLYNQSLIKLPAKCTWWVSGKLKIMEILANSWRQSNERRKKPTKHSHNYCKHPINFSFTVWGTDQPIPKLSPFIFCLCAFNHGGLFVWNTFNYSESFIMSIMLSRWRKKKEKNGRAFTICMCLSIYLYIYYILVRQFHRYNPCNNQSLENMMAKVFKDKLPDLSDNHLVMKWFPFYNLKY